ncbi:hypothetical protein ACFV6F_08030 [Kitasatospora phosalacinea]|uniref:hypothetical protein n=1 Tax=Kitasatospora phosalacinea TaxID=2065 RepID=UPI003662EFF6
MTAPGTRGRVPLYEHALQLHRAGPDAPLPRTVRLPDEERYRRAEQRRRWQPGLAGARTAALLQQRLDRPLTPAGRSGWPSCGPTRAATSRAGRP